MICERCGGSGIIVRAGVRWTEAARCTCLGGEEACPLCRGRGFTYQEQRGYQMAHPCRCRQIGRTIDRIQAIRLPARYATATLDTWLPQTAVQRQVLEEVRVWLAAYQPGAAGLLLSGTAGTGKTHLVAACLRHLVQAGLGGRFIDWTALQSDLRATYARKDDEQETLRPLQTVELLVLDDLAKGKMGEWQIGLVDLVMHARYNGQLTTCITTNLPLDAPAGSGVRTLTDAIGFRAASRLQEMCVPMVLDGDDYRARRRPQRPARTIPDPQVHELGPEPLPPPPAEPEPQARPQEDTMATAKITPQQIKKLWAVARSSGLETEAVHELLRAEAGVQSVTELSRSQAARIIDRIIGKQVTDAATPAQVRMIQHQAREMGWTDPARLSGFLQRMAGTPDPWSLTRTKASAIIEALKAIATRGPTDRPLPAGQNP